MSTRYQIKCVNSTDKPFYFGAYQDSIAWQVRGVPPKGSIPSISDANWSDQYGVSIASWDIFSQSYSALQVVDAELGFSYRVLMTEYGIPSIDPIPTGTISPEQIMFANDTNVSIDMGFTLDDILITVYKESPRNSTVAYVPNIYYVACFNDINEGQIVDSRITIEPVTVNFENGYTKCEVEVAIDGGRYYLKDPVYVPDFKKFAHPELAAAAQASTVALAFTPQQTK